jgi:hypothetical protein
VLAPLPPLPKPDELLPELAEGPPLEGPVDALAPRAPAEPLEPPPPEELLPEEEPELPPPKVEAPALARLVPSLLQVLERPLSTMSRVALPGESLDSPRGLVVNTPAAPLLLPMP